MARTPLIQQDVLSHLVADHSIQVASETSTEKILIERLELNSDQPSGASLTLSRVHALSTVRRSHPIYLVPARSPAPLNRSAELETLRQSVLPRHVVDLHGPDGAGKSTLAATLAHDLNLNPFVDGTVFVSGRLRCQDLLQALFDILYTSENPVKITPGQARSYLGNLRVLVILDDLGLGPKQVDPILDALDEAAVLIVGPERTALGRGRAISLSGLPRPEAVALFERALGRTPSADEIPVIDQLCALLQDTPLSILGVSSQAAHSKQALATLLAELHECKPWGGPGAHKSVGPTLEQIVLSLDAIDRQLLTLTAAFAGPSASAEALQGLMHLSNFEFQESVRRLHGLGLLRAVWHDQQRSWFDLDAAISPRLALTSAYYQTVRTWLVDEATRLQVVNHFASRLGQGGQLPGAELPGLLGAVEDCARNGWLDQLKPLARAADYSLGQLRWWAERQHVLDLTRRAAQGAGERTLESWATHQLGTVVGALGDLERAIHLLRTSLHMRQANGDQTGAALTARNLDLIEYLLPAPVVEPSLQTSPAAQPRREAQGLQPVPSDQEPIIPIPSDAGRGRRLKVGLALLIALAVLLVGALLLRFVAGVGVNQERTPGLTVSWEFGTAVNAYDNQTWTQQIIVVAQGNAEDIRYFVNGEPTTEMFEVVLPLCEGAQGTIRVEAGDGQSAEVQYEFDSPYCR